jgi:hypothetical protein
MSDLKSSQPVDKPLFGKELSILFISQEQEMANYYISNQIQ